MPKLTGEGPKEANPVELIVRHLVFEFHQVTLLKGVGAFE
jgi:hypothetical protein